MDGLDQGKIFQGKKTLGLCREWRKEEEGH